MASNYDQDENDYGYDYSEESDSADQRYNNDQLQKAIRYMISEGRGDDLDLYFTRVNAIEEHILQNYVNYGKSFDPGLYQRLQSLVREVQDDVFEVDEESSSLSTDSNGEVEALYRNNEDELDVNSDDSSDDSSSVEELYRPGFDDGAVSSVSTNTPKSKCALPPKVQAGAARFSKDEDELEKSFLYGGPDNDKEQWFRDLPPILPFGETPYMERWDSMKINYDLNEAAKKSGDKEPVRTTVPYDDVEPADPSRSYLPSTFDSGSRFKLPVLTPEFQTTNKNRQTEIRKLLPGIVAEFNAGGPSKTRERYVPRIFLPKIADVKFDEKRTPPAAILGNFAIKRKVATERDAVGGKTTALTTTTAPKRRHAPTRDTAPRDTATTRPTRSTALPSKVRPKVPTQPVQAPTTDASTPVKRGRGRPRKVKPTDPTYHPPRRPSVDEDAPATPGGAELEEMNDDTPTTLRKRRPRKVNPDKKYRPSQSPFNIPKRKRDLNMDDDSPVKRTKVDRKKHSVGFAGEAPEPVTKAKPSKKAKPKKSAIKTSGIPPEDRDILESARTITSPKKRGQTRSGAVQFKPLRLRSLPENQ